MKRLSLKSKMIIGGVIPLLCFLILVCYGAFINYQSYHESTLLESKMKVLDAASEMVHESQKERGKSAAYLKGAVTLDFLRNQRKINDQKLKNLRVEIANSVFSPEYKKMILSEVSVLKKLRKQVSDKSIDLGDALKKYTRMIKSLLNIQLNIANSTSLAEMTTSLRAIRILEESKESGGKLRANMSAILAANKPISDKKFSQILSLKSGLVEGIRSYGLHLDKTSESYINSIYSSEEWKIIDNTFNLILKNSNRGLYDKDSKAFFATITKSLNIVAKTINHQKDQLRNKIITKRDKSFELLWQISIFSFGVVLSVLFLLFKISTNSSKTLLQISEVLKKQVINVSESSDLLASMSCQLSDSATQQASSLEETVSSIDEISSMIERNADSASTSTEVSSKSNTVASTGKKKIDEMIVAIDEINTSNNEIMDEMNGNNKEVSRIINVISEIGDKTKVINDIVFQTKLLSFNASVEAARAGEHGRGFAVVAEEVGNLAAMSGKAALEITEMLETSIKQVTQIVDQSKDSIEKLIQKGEEKVERGRLVASECGEVFEEILLNVSSVNEMVEEISTASSEQSTGVKEVTKAMQELDQIAHQYSSAAISSSTTATELKDQATILRQAIEDLNGSVKGTKEKIDYSNEKEVRKYSEETEIDSKNVIKFSKEKETEPEDIHFKTNEGVKVSGLDTSIPSEEDPRFEDL